MLTLDNISIVGAMIVNTKPVFAGNHPMSPNWLGTMGAGTVFTVHEVFADPSDNAPVLHASHVELRPETPDGALHIEPGNFQARGCDSKGHALRRDNMHDIAALEIAVKFTENMQVDTNDMRHLCIDITDEATPADFDFIDPVMLTRAELHCAKVWQRVTGQMPENVAIVVLPTYTDEFASGAHERGEAFVEKWGGKNDFVARYRADTGYYLIQLRDPAFGPVMTMRVADIATDTLEAVMRKILKNRAAQVSPEALAVANRLSTFA
jgi:hypothetical protein